MIQPTLRERTWQLAPLTDIRVKGEALDQLQFSSDISNRFLLDAKTNFYNPIPSVEEQDWRVLMTLLCEGMILLHHDDDDDDHDQVQTMLSEVSPVSAD